MHKVWLKLLIIEIFVKNKILTLVDYWPQLHQCSATTENIKKVEAVQRRWARFVRGDFRYTSSVTAITESLSWETLQHRRQQANAIMMFRIVHVINAMVAIPAFPHLQLLGAATKGHQYKIPYSSINTYKDSFLGSSIRLWSQLPEKLTNAESLEAFKAGILAATQP